MSSPERRLYESLSDDEWLDILEGKTATPRTTTSWNEMLTPSATSDVYEYEPSERITKYADRIGLMKSAKIVELGCGNARNLVGLYERGWTDLLGIDMSRDNLEAASDLCKRKGAEIDLRYGDVRDTRLPSSSYDLAINYYVMMTLPTLGDIKQSAREMRRILKPNGHAIVATIGAESFQRYGERLERAKATYLGDDPAKVAHEGPIYLSKETLLNDMFPDFRSLLTRPILDDYRGIYNHCLLLHRL